MRTAGVKNLVKEALEKVPKPYTEDVIDDVFLEIEHGEEFMTEYAELCRQLGKTTVNTWGGYWIANALGKTGLEQVPARKSKLIRTYSRLTVSATASGKKRKEPEALQLMYDYYQEHKGRLPPNIKNHRDLIVEMIVEGLPVDEVFAMVHVDAVVPAAAQRRR
ncbi:MAG: hypothetical protein ABI831_05265 [Betaproteobacteria bacterium]